MRGSSDHINGGPQPAPPGAGGSDHLVGRESERLEISELLRQARSSRSGVLVIRGEPGVGKSALLDYAHGCAAGMRILRCDGVEPESELAFAGLHQLLRPVLAYVERIPRVQEEALRTALGLAPGVAENRFVIALAVLSLLAEVAADGPVLCLVDDAHWLDHPSADSLAFVARRLEAEGIVMILSTREGDPRSFEGHGLPERTIDGLSPADAEHLLVMRFGVEIPPEIRQMILDAADGNPLALIEIPAALTPAQLTGREAPPLPMPIGHHLQEMLLRRVRRLSGAAQTLMLVAATDGSGEADIVLAAGGLLGVTQAALLEAEASGLIRTEGSALVFRHPILRTAIYQAAGLPRRQAAHSALVQVLQGQANADRRAWHRAALVLYPDDEIADELALTAARARSRSGHAAACAALRRSAELTSSDERRARRLAAAAHAAWDAGRPDQATALLRVVEAEADADTYAEVRQVQGEIELRCGVPLEGAALLIDGAERVAGVDPHKALSMLYDAAMCANYSGALKVMADVGQRAAALSIEESEPDAPFVGLLAGVAAMLTAEGTGYRAKLSRALDRVAETTDSRGLIWASAAAAGIGDHSREEYFRRLAESTARASMAVTSLAMALERNAWSDMLLGHVSSASMHAKEGLQLALETGMTNPACFHRAILAWVAAVRGDQQACIMLATQAADTALEHGLGAHNAIAGWAMGLLHVGRGEWESAAIRLETVASTTPGPGHPYIALRALPDLVEAAIRSDRRDLAAWAAERYARYAGQEASDWEKALAARCLALVADSSAERQRLLWEALAFHDRDRRPLSRARTLLLLGEHLRRARRRKEARVPLHAALDAFEQAAAAPWVERARHELRATGQTVRSRNEGPSAELTIQERQIARIVAGGATNREVADRLFLSPRTVEYHLRSVFAKLGISSRAELVRLHLEQGSARLMG